MSVEDDLQRRLEALRSEQTFTTDDERLAIARQRGGHGITPLATPTAGWLPPTTSPDSTTMPAQITPEDAKINAMVDAFAGSCGTVDGDAADNLMQQAADLVKLEGMQHGSGLGLDQSTIHALASADAGQETSLAAPGDAEVRGLSAGASCAIKDAKAGLAGQRGSLTDVSGSTAYPSLSGAFAGSDDDDDDEDDAAEAERMLAEIQDEILLDKKLAAAPAAATSLASLASIAPTPPSNQPARPLAKPNSAAAQAPLFPKAPTHTVVQRPAVAPASSQLVPQQADESEKWCSICNDDAILWCVGCDGDPYCRRCWREGHVGADASFQGHRSIPITQPRPKSEYDD